MPKITKMRSRDQFFWLMAIAVVVGAILVIRWMPAIESPRPVQAVSGPVDRPQLDPALAELVRRGVAAMERWDR